MPRSNAVPVTFALTYDDASVTVDGKSFASGDKLDMSKKHTLVIECSDGNGGIVSEKWTLEKAVQSNNPVLPGQYADPDIDYFDGKFWIFPTTDGFSGWSGNYFHAFSSTDLVNWTDEGVILDVDKNHEPTTNGDENTAISLGLSDPHGRRPSRKRMASITSTTAPSLRAVNRRLAWR